MATCTRVIEFDAGHRILGHEGKCANLHGHRYRAEITVQAAGLDELGRVIDFGCIKELVGGWIDKNWDHNTILHEDDSFLGCFGFNEQSKSPYVMADNPTAENLARRLFDAAKHALASRLIQVKRIRLYETPNCYADYPDQHPAN